MIIISQGRDQISKIEELCDQIQSELSTYAKSNIMFSRHGTVYSAEFYCNKNEEVVNVKSLDPEDVKEELCETLLSRYELTKLKGCE